MASSREDWQAIGKRRQAVGKRSSESRGRIGEFARRTHAENSRRTSLGNLLASHRGEVRPKAAEVQNHSRYGNCSFSPSFPALAPSPSPRYGGVEPGSKSGPPPSFPNDPIGNPGALGLGSINSVIAIIQRHWIPDWLIRGRRYKKDFHSPPSGSSGKFPAMRSGQILKRPKDANSPQHDPCCKFSEPALAPYDSFTIVSRDMFGRSFTIASRRMRPNPGSSCIFG